MNQEPETAARIQPLPKPTSKKQTLTFTVPHILKSISLDEAGFYHREIRDGGPRQVEHELTQEYADEPASEEEQIFGIRATNQLNFGGSTINVINDEVLLGNGFRLVPTLPTASEYLSKVGQRVQLSSVSTRDTSLSKQQGKDIYRIGRAFITLP